MKKTIKVHQFDPQVYPCLIWITVSTNTYFEGFSELPPMEKGAMAAVCKTYNEKQKRKGIMVRFKSVRDMNVSNITHESYHVAHDIFDYIGAEMDAENQEPFAYLIAWIAGCCEQVKNNKFKD